MISITVLGIPQAVERFARLALASELAAKPMAEAEGAIVLRDAQARVPVETGALKASLRVKPDPEDSSAVLVGSEGLDDIRATATEFGTVNMAAEPWLRPALDAARSKTPAVAVPILLRFMGIGL
jgi:HK97 gp10 family phage protein